MKISVYEYIAHNKPQQAAMLLESEGFPVQMLKDTGQLAKTLEAVEKKIGESFSKKLAEIHPDYQIMESYFKDIHEKEIAAFKANTEKKNNAEGDLPVVLPQPINNSLVPVVSNNKDLIIGISFGFGVAAFLLTAIQVAKLK